MLGHYRERRAARSSRRFQVFIEGKEAYESFVAELEVRFDEMSEAHYRLARRDPRLAIAQEKLAAAIPLSEQVGAIRDAAIARYQLGMVHHCRGELEFATDLFRAALEVFSSLPDHDTLSDESACRYHLGIIHLKQGHLGEAVRELRRSRLIDEADLDLGGMTVCDLALDTCAAAGADMEATLPPPDAEPMPWYDPTFAPPAAPVEDRDPEAPPSGRISYSSRELIVVASYSEAANDTLMAHLEALGGEFHRPVSVSRVAFGSTDPTRRKPSPPAADQHICATILVLEKEGLLDSAFQDFAVASMHHVLEAPDFRLFAYLHDLGVGELRELVDLDLYPFLSLLFDTTQVAAAISRDQLRRTLVPYLQGLEQMRDKARWRTLHLHLVRLAGYFATGVLGAALLLTIAGTLAVLLRATSLLHFRHAPELASLLVGTLAFPLQAPLIYFLLRGVRVTAVAPRDNERLGKFAVFGLAVMYGASYLQKVLDGPVAWLYLGVAVGLVLDATRRAGLQAQRQMIDLGATRFRAADASWGDPRLTVLRGDPINPFSCPLLPVFAPRVFISYAPSSGKGKRLAYALHGELNRAGALPFLDRVTIPPGANWRREISQRVGECDVFLCLLDERSAQRDWVAAEFLTALAARRLTGTPQIVVLVDPSFAQHPCNLLPVFAGIMSTTAQAPVLGRPRLIVLNKRSTEVIAWGLAPSRFQPLSIFTRVAAAPLYGLMAALGMLGGLALLVVPVIGLLAFFERAAGYPFAAMLTARHSLAPAMLLTAFSLGFALRSMIAWGHEVHRPEGMGVAPLSLAFLGSAIALPLLIPHASSYAQSWAVVAAVVGWGVVGAFTARSQV